MPNPIDVILNYQFYWFTTALSADDNPQVASIVTSNRKLAMKSLVLLSFLGLLGFQVVAGIKCYQCSSLTNSKCGEPFHESPTMIVDCDKEIYPIGPPVKSSFCRKIHQTSKKRREINIVPQHSLDIASQHEHRRAEHDNDRI